MLQVSNAFFVLGQRFRKAQLAVFKLPDDLFELLQRFFERRRLLGACFIRHSCISG
jgi:hypothetical protein